MLDVFRSSELPEPLGRVIKLFEIIKLFIKLFFFKKNVLKY